MPPSGKARAGAERRPAGVQRGTALALAGVALAMLVLVAVRDLTWKREYETALERGRLELVSADFDAARRSFLQSLTANPYGGEAHFALAALLDGHFGDNAGALEHYRAGLAFAPSHPRAGEAKRAAAILGMIMEGVIEDPLAAAADMALAVGEDAFPVFAARLGPEAGAHASAYWQGWRERGPGVPVQRRLVQNAGGDISAVVVFSYADGASMPMRFRCAPKTPWRLASGFP